MLEFNYLAVLVAAISAFAIGGLWYSPLLFEKAWKEDTGITEQSPQGHPGRVFGVSFVFALLSAAAFAHLVGPAPDFTYSLHVGLVTGIFFVAASYGINYQFANRSTRLWLIDGGYHVVQFAVYGAIIGAWH